jgi:hypothetical protein
MGLLEILAVILLIAWLGGLSLNVAGGFIHILLVVALVLFVVRMLRSSTTV